MVAPCCICPGSSRAAPQTYTNQRLVLLTSTNHRSSGHNTCHPDQLLYCIVIMWPIRAHLTALIAFSRCGSCSSCPESRKPLSYLDMEKIFIGDKKYFLDVHKNCCPPVWVAGVSVAAHGHGPVRGELVELQREARLQLVDGGGHRACVALGAQPAQRGGYSSCGHDRVMCDIMIGLCVALWVRSSGLLLPGARV